MVKVITYGTYDLLHYGHIRLLERAKALGDYLIVGVTSDDFDKTRGKINNQQSLTDRLEAVRATGIADEVIVEEYEGQKIDDIRKYNIDIFTVGSDWQGHFDYLSNYCKVVYLSRTEGVSSTELRADKNHVRIGIIGETDTTLTSIDKFMREVRYVNGVEPAAILGDHSWNGLENIEDYDEFLDRVDAVYVASHPSAHFRQVSAALEHGKHVLCESPFALTAAECEKLFELAKANKCILMEGIKTAYATAYERLLLLIKSGKIGEVVSVDSVCTSMKDFGACSPEILSKNWNTITEWGPPGLLPVFQILGSDFIGMNIASKMIEGTKDFDIFSKIDLTYPSAVASVRIGKGMKSEGELVVSGTKGYIIVPAPWWKTDYFEVRFEDPSNNKRYFYQLDGEGIRYEIAAFVRAITAGRQDAYVDPAVSKAICTVMEKFYSGNIHCLK
ncbi:Gfo/Idh/MocA family oxidoreductase [Ruminococcus flavefaciens]|uniref:Glycerol-3-phosphate cytidylyltransferase n=1 Tax=Ruminococcus flavefaciens 007c TaxID=1341157 RepID=W7UMG8_RUMFL|nr:Gfo/Idh/MocA family oxidoreductase [Ruminococcus flavefaciens]EWM54998.1 hypothetical protein RF007C_03105 [Ruminococcus flavefaciens 007c]